MALNAAMADRPAPRFARSQERSGEQTKPRSRKRSRIILLALASIVSSMAVATWIANSDFPALASAALSANVDRGLTFADRFFPSDLAETPVSNTALKSSRLAMVERRILPAQGLLASAGLPQDFRAGFADDEARVVEAKPTATGGIPLPRSRPAVADLEARPASALALAGSAGRPNDRSLLQRLSDLMPGRLTLASLAPDGGLLFRRGPDLAALGYDSMTAVYDISAHAVYLPNGSVLEAHSGIGSLRDDPEHVSVPNQGATPPAVYELKPREKDFHGVQALRMTPVEGSDIFGRSGLLTHSFMLGANGDSNGCVSIKDYDRFLKAFNDGQFNRLVVVPSLNNGALASQGVASRS
jgi:hypothetical protein